MAERTLSLASFIEASGKPTIDIAGRELTTSVSTETSYAFIPIAVAVFIILTTWLV